MLDTVVVLLQVALIRLPRDTTGAFMSRLMKKSSKGGAGKSQDKED